MKMLPILPFRARRRGFTLMELLLVLAIIGLLMGGGAAVYSGVMDQARSQTTKAKIDKLSAQIIQYAAQKNKFPTQSDGLQALKRTGSVRTDEEILDNWTQPLIYTFPAKRGGDKFDLWSKGPDGLENTNDDIGNWPNSD